MVDQASNLRKIIQNKKENKTVIYTISSGKGGVGKSNVALNLACQLRKDGKNVLILDTDYGFANINVLAGVATDYTITDVLGDRRVAFEDIIVEYEGVKIIPGGNDIFNFSHHSIEEINYIQKQFSRMDDLDVIIVDTSAGINSSIMSYIILSNETILVTTPEITSLMDVYSMMKNISVMKLKEKVKLIINKVSSEQEALDTFAKLNQVASSYLQLELEYLGYVYQDQSVSEAIKEQIPFVDLFPNSPASRSIQSIGYNLLGLEEQIKGSTMSEIYQKIFRIFSR